MAAVFLNGRFLDAADARVSAFDAGLQHGVGLFETMQASLIDGRAHVRHLEWHLQRLVDSCRELGLSDALRPHALAEAVAQTVEHARLPRARVRLTITGGDLNLLTPRRDGGAGASGSESASSTPRRHDPTVLIVAQPPPPYPPVMFERGVSAVIADLKLNPLDPFAGHKTLNYWPRLRELQIAAGKGAGEALVFQVTNHLAGGCVSNAFIAKGGTLLTPISRGEEAEAATALAAASSPQTEAPPRGPLLPSPVLPGTARRWVIEHGAALGITCARRMLTIDDVLGADELFLTNSSWGVLPVVRVESATIGAGATGPITGQLRDAWAAEVG